MKNARRIFLCLFLSLLLVGGGCTSAVDTRESSTASNTEFIELTQSEKDFIKEHPVIHLGVDPEFIPYEFIDTDGKYKGIAADYIDLICKMTGLQMVAAPDLIWSEAYELAVEKELDVLPCVSKTAAREQYFLFSDPYYSFQRAVYINETNKKISSFEDLSDMTVAVQANSSHHSYLIAFDTISLSLYPTVEDALQAVSNGDELAFVGNFATTNYLIKKNGITNLAYFKINSNEPQSLYFAVRNDWPELVSIINKALVHIDKEDKITIDNKWLGVESSVDYTEIFRYLKIAGVVIAAIFAVSVLWILRLRKEIAIRKKTQEELNAAKDEAERANQIKSIFLARMSHEIRTPLNTITGMSYLIKKTGVTTTQGIYLDKLTQAARNMLGIINDILDFSKTEAGKIEIERISFDLDKVLQRVIDIAGIKVEEQGIDFTMDKDPVMPVRFYGDPTRIEQILANLLSNAIKFTEKGSVSLSVRVLSRLNDVYHIEFCVKDTGIGMLPDQVSRIFLPFDQADSSINRRFGGTGLGLSIVKNLTDLMGGEIDVKSAENEGSVFRISLPLEADKDTLQTVEQKMAADCFRGIHALVLDKNENTSTSPANCLKSFGIKAEYVSSEEEAMHMIRSAAKKKRQYNLLVVDYLTPGDGGIEYLNRIKKLPFFKNPPKSMLIIPMSREELYDEIETAGIDFGITKPVIPSVIYNGIIEIYKITPPEAVDASEKQNILYTSYPYHILLVEDNKTNQFIAQTILEQAGFRVSKANNGEEGYKFFSYNRKELDLILMDIHMPVMDGYTATDLIRAVDTDIPIVAMTADAIMGVEENCKIHGLTRYVSKPFDPEQFIQTVLNVLKDKKPKTNTQKDEKNDPDKKIVPDQKSSQKESADDSSSPVPAGTAGSTGHVLDTAAGLTLIGGDAVLYHIILKEYYNENSAVLLDLNNKIIADNYEDAVQIVHKTKSSSGNIGANILYEASSELQKALKSKDEINIIKWHRTFDELMHKLLIEIEVIIKE